MESVRMGEKEVDEKGLVPLLGGVRGGFYTFIKRNSLDYTTHLLTKVLICLTNS